MVKAHNGKTHIMPVIMSGGAGTRLWPASRSQMPKQLLQLTSDQTMIQETTERLRGQFERPQGAFRYTDPLIVCNHKHGETISKQIADIGIKPSCVILEPVPRNTAPCAAIAALAVAQQDPDALMLLAPADHHIRNKAAFSATVASGLAAALDGYLVTFGITAETPETGYGYIQKGEELGETAHKIAAFKEKPAQDTARQYIASGQYFWNAGIFMCKPAALLREMEIHSPEILAACKESFHASTCMDGMMALDMDTFSLCPSDSIDYAVMEKTEKAAVVEADMGWSDIGSWSALWQFSQDANDPKGNALRGDVLAMDTHNTLIHSEDMFVATIGVDNLAIVVQGKSVLVAHQDKVQDVKKVVEFLKSRGDTEKL